MLLERHSGWAAPVEQLIRATSAASILRNDVVDRKPDATWGRGRVTLLGDAAHPMSFNVGQGACQAIEDGIALARSLSSGSDPVQALRQYEVDRQPRTGTMQRTARMIGKMGAWRGRATVALRSAVIRSLWEGPVFKLLDQDMRSGARWPTARLTDLR